MSSKESAYDIISSWYGSLPIQRDGSPSRGAIAAALVVLDRLKEQYDLTLDFHLAPGGAQVKGASGQAVARILGEFGETRPFVKEGGRTNRGSRSAIELLLTGLSKTRLENLDYQERVAVLNETQKFLVDRVRDYHNRQRMRIIYNPGQTAWQMVADLLDEAHKTGKDGPVAQYLVGAKLQLRFPDESIGNESYSTADDQLKRPGDFCIGDTAFHVTVTPTPGVYERARANIAQGYRAYLLVPDRSVVGTRQNAETVLPGQIAVESIESFVGHNLEELAVFSRDRLAEGFLRLLRKYNERVDSVELDKSMLIEIPRNLQRLDHD